MGNNLKKIVIYGAGGAARDIIRLINLINRNVEKWLIIGVIVDDISLKGELFEGHTILGNHNSIKGINGNELIGVIIASGIPSNKVIMYNKLRENRNIYYPNLIHPDVSIYQTNFLGQGVVIEEGVIITTNVRIGDFVTINVGASISHDCEIHNFVTISPKAAIAGNVEVLEGSFIGINATIIEKKQIGCNTTIGAGAVVLNDIPNNCTAVGIPAKPIKFNNNKVEEIQ